MSTVTHRSFECARQRFCPARERPRFLRTRAFTPVFVVRPRDHIATGATRPYGGDASACRADNWEAIPVAACTSGCSGT